MYSAVQLTAFQILFITKFTFLHSTKLSNPLKASVYSGGTTEKGQDLTVNSHARVQYLSMDFMTSLFIIQLKCLAKQCCFIHAYIYNHINNFKIFGKFSFYN